MTYGLCESTVFFLTIKKTTIDKYGFIPFHNVRQYHCVSRSTTDVALGGRTSLLCISSKVLVMCCLFTILVSLEVTGVGFYYKVPHEDTLMDIMNRLYAGV